MNRSHSELPLDLSSHATDEETPGNDAQIHTNGPIDTHNGLEESSEASAVATQEAHAPDLHKQKKGYVTAMKSFVGHGPMHESFIVKKDELDDGGWDSNQVWLQNNRNAYGAFVHVALQSGLPRAMSLSGFMLVTSMFVQVTFSKWLINRHWSDFSDLQDALCELPLSLTFSATFIFVTLMMNEANGMYNATSIALFSTHHIGGDGDQIGGMCDIDDDNLMAKPLNHHFIARLVIFLVGAMGEIMTWAMILVSGIIWICTSTDVDLIIRSTVSIMFVLNVDELIYEACCPTPIMEDVEETRYRMPSLGLGAKVPVRWRLMLEYTFGVYIYLVVLISFALLVVISIRLYMSECPYITEWHDGNFWTRF